MSNARWQITPQQAKPDKLHATLKQVLKMHYDLVDQHAALQKSFADAQAQIKTLQNAPPAGGALNSQLLGIQVQPTDTQTLANGATLKYDKPSGTLKIS